MLYTLNLYSAVHQLCLNKTGNKTKSIKKKACKSHFCKKGFPDGSMVKSLPADGGEMGSIPDSGRSHGIWGNQLLGLRSRAQEP